MMIYENQDIMYDEMNRCKIKIKDVGSKNSCMIASCSQKILYDVDIMYTKRQICVITDVA